MLKVYRAVVSFAEVLVSWITGNLVTGTHFSDYGVSQDPQEAAAAD
jgi:hypothetical protein